MTTYSRSEIYTISILKFIQPYETQRKTGYLQMFEELKKRKIFQNLFFG